LTRHRSINALAESVIGLYKTELVWAQGPWRTAEELELATLLHVERFNTRRIHSEIGDRPPAEHEADHYRRNRQSAAL